MKTWVPNVVERWGMYNFYNRQVINEKMINAISSYFYCVLQKSMVEIASSEEALLTIDFT